MILDEVQDCGFRYSTDPSLAASNALEQVVESTEVGEKPGVILEINILGRDTTNADDDCAVPNVGQCAARNNGRQLLAAFVCPSWN